MPGRRKRLQSNSELNRGSFLRGGQINAISRKRRRIIRNPSRRAVRLAVFARDGYRCVVRTAARRIYDDYGYDVGGCFGELTFSHRRKEGQGGAYTEMNGTTMCSHHNTSLEGDARLAAIAHDEGWVVRRGDPEWEALGG